MQKLYVCLMWHCEQVISIRDMFSCYLGKYCQLVSQPGWIQHLTTLYQLLLKHQPFETDGH